MSEHTVEQGKEEEKEKHISIQRGSAPCFYHEEAGGTDVVMEDSAPAASMVTTGMVCDKQLSGSRSCWDFQPSDWQSSLMERNFLIWVLRARLPEERALPYSRAEEERHSLIRARDRNVTKEVCFWLPGQDNPAQITKKKTALRDQWMEFIVTEHQRSCASVFVCSLHFEDACFTNKAQFDAGFAHRLFLKDNAVPMKKGHDHVLEPQAIANSCLDVIVMVAKEKGTDVFAANSYVVVTWLPPLELDPFLSFPDNIGSKDYILLPAWMPGHWMLCVLKPKNKAMYFFDSTHPYGIGDVKYVTVFRLHYIHKYYVQSSQFKVCCSKFVVPKFALH
ncbi:uncharacterized protein LOC127988495 isoform X2 [Carassius gibelio]|uniref:uncharacterized protein LOC127988495 isoform X2 n=1 Tax=Carassius gibelio TaxID=101364 RepID=UPI002278022F|nr:uncharacterized protein LOC127988495 isoform X2 [Carassius gibelio]